MSRVSVYVCGPVTGMPGRNADAFEAAATALALAGYAPIVPTRLVPEGTPHEAAMRRLVPELCACDGVCAIDGWERSAGASLEVAVARACGIPVGPLGYWVEPLGGGG